MEGINKALGVPRPSPVKGDLPDYQHEHDTRNAATDKDGKGNHHHHPKEEAPKGSLVHPTDEEHFEKKTHHDHGNDPKLGLSLDVDG